MKTIKKLKSLGLTENEAKLFIALLTGRLMSASEIADDAQIRRTDVYGILKSFVEKGYCNEIETNAVLKYELIDPGVILDKLERNINLHYNEELNALLETFEELKPLRGTKDLRLDKKINIELVRAYGKNREERFIELLTTAKKEILFIIKPENDIINDFYEESKSFIKNGGTIKVIYQVNENFKIRKNGKWTKGTLSDFIKICSEYKKSGEEIKLSISPVPNMTIFDGETVFMNINDKTLPKHNEADLLVSNKEFAENMRIVFESLWEKGKELESFV